MAYVHQDFQPNDGGFIKSLDAALDFEIAEFIKTVSYQAMAYEQMYLNFDDEKTFHRAGWRS